MIMTVATMNKIIKIQHMIISVTTYLDLQKIPTVIEEHKLV